MSAGFHHCEQGIHDRFKSYEMTVISIFTMSVIYSNSEVFLFTFSSGFLLGFDLFLLCDLLPVHGVLLLVESRPSFGIHEPVVCDQLLLKLRLELDHLFQGNNIVLTTTVEPELENHFAIDFVTVSELIAVHLEASELVLSNQDQLPAQVRDFVRVALEDHIEECRPITSALTEFL